MSDTNNTIANPLGDIAFLRKPLWKDGKSYYPVPRKRILQEPIDWQKEQDDFEQECKWEEQRTLDEKEIKKSIKEFMIEVAEQEPDWVAERRIEYLKNQIAELQKKINWWTAMSSHYKEIGTETSKMFVESIDKTVIVPFKKQKDKLQNEIDLYLNPVIVDYSSKIIDGDIERAKEVPMNTLIDFNRAGFAICLFHNERTASMKWWKKHNVVKCFSCGEAADTIKVYRKLNNSSFREAVENLKRF